MIDPFVALGLPRSATLAEIKTAYAAKLKVIRPEEDPQGFMALREAYDAARAQQDLVRFQRETTFTNAGHSAVIAEDNPHRPASNATDHGTSNFDNTQDDWTIPADAVDGAIACLDDMAARETVIGRAEMAALLDDDALQDIASHQSMARALRQWVLRQTGFYDEDVDDVRIPHWLTPDALAYAGDAFGWRDRVGRALWDWNESDWIVRVLNKACGPAADPDPTAPFAQSARAVRLPLPFYLKFWGLLNAYFLYRVALYYVDTV